MTEHTQSLENKDQSLTDLVNDLDGMRMEDASSDNRKPALEQKARMDRIYEEYDTKESVMEAIESLEGMKVDLEKKKEEKAGIDVDTLNVQISAIEKAMEPLKTALESLKALSETNPAVVSISEQLHQLEVQRNELSVTLRQYEGIGDPSMQIALIDRAIEDFKAVIKYFKKTAERIANVDERYAELPGEMAVPLPVNPEDRRKVLALQKNTVRKMKGTLRSLSVIEEPGKGQLAKDETIRERTEAFMGKEASDEKEVFGMKPDKREEIMALWFAGLEPDAANLRKVRAFFKSPDYLRIRTGVNKRMEKIEVLMRNYQRPGMSFPTQVEMVKNILARLFSQASAGIESELEEIFYALENNVPIHFNLRESVQSSKESHIDYNVGVMMEKFDENRICTLAMGRTKIRPGGFPVTNYEDLPDTKKIFVNNQEKIIIAEIFPFLAEQLGAGVTGHEEINKINKRLSGFVTFNEQDGPAMTEDIPNTGGRDAINRLASLRYHAAKKAKEQAREEQARKAEEEQKQSFELARRQQEAETALSNADKRIKELIQAAFDAYDKHQELKTVTDKYDGKQRERTRLFKSSIEFVDSLGESGVSMPSGYEDKTNSIEYLDLVIEQAKKKAKGLLVGKETKRSIESSLYNLENVRKGIFQMEQELEEEWYQYEDVRQKLIPMREDIIRQIDEIGEEVKKRNNIEPVGNMRISNLMYENIYLRKSHQVSSNTIQAALDTLEKNYRLYMEKLLNE